VTSIALEMVIPGILGFWLDQNLGTVMVFLVLGVALGMTVGMIHLLRLAKSIGFGSPTKSSNSQRKDSRGP
jgi:F0F1-type ATP synthase assembly protein I